MNGLMSVQNKRRMYEKEGVMVIYFLILICVTIALFALPKFVRANSAYHAFCENLARTQQRVDQIRSRNQQEQSKIEMAQRILEGHVNGSSFHSSDADEWAQRLLDARVIMGYNDLSQIDPYGIASSVVESAFVYNIGSKSSVIVSFYCWARGFGSDTEKEASLKCLRCLFYLEKSETGWLSSFRHIFTTTLLKNMLNREYNNTRLDGLRDAIRKGVGNDNYKEEIGVRSGH